MMIIAESPETIDSLQAYFWRVGVASHARRTLDDLKRVTLGSTALVLFPDDFEAGTVQRSILALRAEPAPLLVIVTAAPQRLASSVHPNTGSRQPVVLPKPAFGWAILDAVRGQDDP